MEINDLFDFELNEAEGYWSVTGYNGRGEEVVFPAAYEGKPVKTIGDRFAPDNKRIKSVNIPEGYTSIGKSAFEDCTEITEIKLPESLTSIGDSAFNGCTELAEITVDENNPVFRSIDGVLFDKAMTTLMRFPAGKKGVFSVPNGIINIKSCAFEYCKLTGISFPKSLASIGERAFVACNGLTEIKLPEGLTSIGEYTFAGCYKLTKIKFPESLTTIGTGAFFQCFKLTEIRLPESLTSIEEIAFSECTGLTEIKLPEGLTSIGDSAFSCCTRLKDIKLPKSLASIESGVFQCCSGLTEIKLPEGLTSIEGHVFYCCTELAEINVDENNPVFRSVDGVLFDKAMTTLMRFPEGKKGVYSVPDGIINIKPCAFGNCKLTGISFPKSLASIELGALYDCTELLEISVDESNPVFRSVDGVLFDKAMTTLMRFPEGKKGRYSVPEGIVAIESDAFYNCKLTGISFPKSLEIIDGFGFYGYQLTDITVSELNPVFCSIDGVLFDKDKSELIFYPRNKGKTDYAVPDGIKFIKPYAFYQCNWLVNIVLPEGLENIDNHAFAGCEGLKAIKLPMSLQFIGEHAFEDCSSLETVTLSRKTRIGHEDFEGFKGRLVYRD